MGWFKSSSENELRDAIRKLAGQVADLEEKHERLKVAHESLRGYTYSLKAKHVAGLTSQPETPPALTRDDLRRRSGFVPGRPMEHKDGKQ